MLEENGSQPLLKSPGHSSETTGTSTAVPQASAEFRNLPHDAEEFGTIPQVAERKENHTLTVRETARMFEATGAARTERSIINWCQPNRQGIARLDSYFDPNERKYYITPQSVEAVIQEEVQRAKKSSQPGDSEGFGSGVTHVKHSSAAGGAARPDIEELKREVANLKLTNQVKDQFIQVLKTERFEFIERLQNASRITGQLETKLNLLDKGKP
jgi:hypothetical protein